jgi:very-short-patch-repair endonuclease
MIKCRVCGKEFENQQFLSTHLSRNKKDHPLTKDYFEMYKDDFTDVEKPDKKCKLCGKDTEFINVNRGYKNYCSQYCRNNTPDKFERKKQTCLKKYGTESFSQTDEYKTKYKKTIEEKYGKGIINPFQAKEVKEKSKQTNIEKRGVEYAMQSEEVKEKSRQSLLEAYGVDHIAKSDYFKDKVKQTCIDKYGVENVMHVNEIKEKLKETTQEKYGVYNISQNENIKQKKSDTTFKKFGVQHPMQSELVREKSKSTLLSRYGVDNISKSEYISEIKSRHFLAKMYDKLINSDRLKYKVAPLFSLEEYKGSKNEVYSFKCTTCNHEFEDRVHNGRIPRCPKCFPFNVSQLEIDIRTYIESIYNGKLIFNDRSIIGPLELDIVIPDLKLAIEVNGIFWHSDEMKPVGYHENKTNKCKEVGYELLYIWEDDWDNEQKLVKELLENIIINNGELYV